MKNNQYILPKILSAPISLVPPTISTGAIVMVLNKTLKSYLINGELDFLKDKVLSIKIEDINVCFAVSIDESKKTIINAVGKQADMTIAGNLYEFLLLIVRSEDPDTLFFNRRLKMSGDTELGLNVKNFLDSIEFDDLKYGKTIEKIFKKSTTIYPKLFKLRDIVPKYSAKYKYS
ncbi:MAG: sterol-binding protein [Gammaproteobacteria bacterium]|nr:MAG: sterol-binding protein [Gammaproteobacteria bacterium]